MGLGFMSQVSLEPTSKQPQWMGVAPKVVPEVIAELKAGSRRVIIQPPTSHLV